MLELPALQCRPNFIFQEIYLMMLGSNKLLGSSYVEDTTAKKEILWHEKFKMQEVTVSYRRNLTGKNLKVTHSTHTKKMRIVFVYREERN